MSVKLKIMSFNMCCDYANDGNNNFENRKQRIVSFLEKENADVIGFQEITPSMQDWLVSTLTDYYTVGIGRSANYGDETELIAFKKRDFALKSCDTVMLSSTPTQFGTHYDGSDQSPCSREYVRACLKHRNVAQPFYVYNVHTDHIGQISRILAASQLLQDITSHNQKFFMTGDFNAEPTAPEITMITACKARKIVDATASLSGTYHSYGNQNPPQKIDYIFTDADTNILSAMRTHDEPEENKPYLSDHNPICIVVEL
jgi:endonuclease/exonuclease/phosphatase family metal-dependent hydrolase